MITKIRECLLLKLVLPTADLIMGTKIVFWLKQITKLNLLSVDEITNWQNKQLQKFINHAYYNTSYYKQLFDSLNIHPDQIKTISDLQKIPPIDKDIIRANNKGIIPTNINSISYKKGRTGGTTGMPLHYNYDEDTWGYITAAKIYAWKTTGYRYGETFITLGSSSLFPTNKKSWKHIIYFFIRSGIPLNGMNISDDIARKYVNIMIKKKVKYIYGYSASIFLLTKYIQKNSIDMSHIKGVFTTSEVLTPEYRTLMEETYQCKVMDCYGARDAGITGYEIKPGKYHVGYNALVRLENMYDINTGTALVTNILNYSFPLINYRLGDDLKLAGNQPRYNGQVITKVIGRTSDVMHLDNGNNLTATGFSIMIRDFNVVAFRMIKVHGFKIKLEIQPKPQFNEEEKKFLLQTMKKHTGEQIEIEIIFVNSLKPLHNGKRQYFIC